MLDIGPALRVIVHLNADVSSSHEFLHNDILAFLYDERVAGATVFRPEAGFGYHHRLHTKGAPGSEGQHLPDPSGVYRPARSCRSAYARAPSSGDRWNGRSAGDHHLESGSWRQPGTQMKLRMFLILGSLGLFVWPGSILAPCRKTAASTQQWAHAFPRRCGGAHA